MVAIVLAYLLEWPVIQMIRIGLPRPLAVVIVLVVFIGVMILAMFGLVPTVWKQVGNLINDIPNMYNGLQHFLTTLPDKYPELARVDFE